MLHNTKDIYFLYNLELKWLNIIANLYIAVTLTVAAGISVDVTVTVFLR